MPDPSLRTVNPGLAEGARCRRCGAPTGTVAVVCTSCATKQYLAEQLLYIAEVLAEKPAIAIEVARDRRQIPHLTLFANWRIAWCGALVTQPRGTRRRFQLEHLPPGMCEECIAARRGVEEIRRGLEAET